MPSMFRPCNMRERKSKKNGKVVGWSQKANVWKSPSTIIKANKHLNSLAKKGELVGIDRNSKMIQVSAPRENAIYTINLNKKGYIKSIVRF